MIPISQRRYVPSSGPVDAKIAIVGEAPGGDEENLGFGFAGAAGQELNRMLNDAGLLRNDCYVTNVFKVRPTDNNIKEFVSFHKKPPDASWKFFNGAWVHPEVYAYIEALRTELTLLKPNVVVAAGNIALWALTGKTGIQKWRGSLLESTLVPVLKVIPISHPAAILRVWPWRWDAVQDLRRVLRESTFPEVRYPDWFFTIRPSFDEVHRTFDIIEKKLKQGELYLSVDIETAKAANGLIRLISCIGIAWSLTEAICIPLERKNGESYWTSAEELSILSRFFTLGKHPNARVIGQNFLYDAYYFALLYGVKLCPHHDTLLGMHFLYPGKPKALHEQASLFCEYYRYWKDEGKIIDWRTPEEQVWQYNCQDTIYTLEVALAHEQLFRGRPTHLWDFMRKRWDSAFEMMLRGVRTDPTKREVMRDELKAIMKSAKASLDFIFQEDLKPRSAPRMKQICYDELKLDPVNDRKTHKPSVNDPAMDALQEQEPILKPIFNIVRRYKTAGVLKATFVDAKGPIDRFLASFNPAGTETSRWSSSKNPQGWGMNLQNVPKAVKDEVKFPEIRNLFLPDPGYFIWEVDQKSADLHVVVWEANDEPMKAKMRSQDFLDGKLDMYVDEAKEAGIIMPRQAGKMFIHLTNYGGTPRVASMACKIKVAEADQLQKQWFAKHHGIKVWHERVYNSIHSSARGVSNAFGLRITYFNRLDDVLKEALAWIPQSTVANVTDYAIINVRERLPEVCEVLINGHDSILGQSPLEVRSTIGPMLRSVLQVSVPYNDPLTIPWDLKIGNPSWGEAKRGCWACMRVKEECTCQKKSILAAV
jgi:uracil-DNA glycosylase/DNA polymerase I-like protein with 3'-5' exonuclease and polymerase domains